MNTFRKITLGIVLCFVASNIQAMMTRHGMAFSSEQVFLSIQTLHAARLESDGKVSAAVEEFFMDNLAYIVKYVSAVKNPPYDYLVKFYTAFDRYRDMLFASDTRTEQKKTVIESLVAVGRAKNLVYRLQHALLEKYNAFVLNRLQEQSKTQDARKKDTLQGSIESAKGMLENIRHMQKAKAEGEVVTKVGGFATLRRKLKRSLTGSKN